MIEATKVGTVEIEGMHIADWTIAGEGVELLKGSFNEVGSQASYVMLAVVFARCAGFKGIELVGRTEAETVLIEGADPVITLDVERNTAAIIRKLSGA